MRTCFSFLANILSPIPQIQRHTELNTMPHSPLDWLGISAVLMASLSSVPKPGWLHVIFFGTQVLSAAFVPHMQLPVAISTRVSHHRLSSSWRSLLWASPLILFLLGTQDQNPAVFFIPSFLTYNSCSAFRTCIETPYSPFHLSSLFHWHVSSLSLQTQLVSIVIPGLPDLTTSCSYLILGITTEKQTLAWNTTAKLKRKSSVFSLCLQEKSKQLCLTFIKYTHWTLSLFSILGEGLQHHSVPWLTSLIFSGMFFPMHLYLPKPYYFP